MDIGILHHHINKILVISIVISCILFTILINYFSYCFPSIKSHRNLESSSSLNITTINLLQYYHFSKNISQYPYIGSWDNLFFKKKILESTSGEAIINFSPINHNQTIMNSIGNNEALEMKIILKDGRYIDNLIRMNCTMEFPNEFTKDLLQAIKSRKTLNLFNNNRTLNIYYGEYFGVFDDEIYEETDIDITFIPNELLFHNNIEVSSLIYFGNVTISIINKKNHFSLDISSAQMENLDYYSNDILNYSIILSIIGLIEMYFSIKMLINVNTNNQVGLNLDLMTIISQIMYNSVICSIHFFLALSDNKYSYEYRTPSMVYFILFSVIQLKILFFTFKSRHNEISHTDILLFRRKLFQFYSFFYAGLFICLITVRFWYQSFFLAYLVFFSTWIGQIVHSAQYGTKPPMSIKYIFILTIIKCFLPLYLKAYPNNIFLFRPAYGKVFIIIFTLFIEASILLLQHLIGPKFFLPNFLRKKTFEYYRSIDEIANLQNECVICLEQLNHHSRNNSNIENQYTIEGNVSLLANVDIEMNVKGKPFNEKLIDFILQFKPKIKKKDYMITPCSHTFHTICLEQWLEMKNECPYCRQKIPPLEY